MEHTFRLAEATSFTFEITFLPPPAHHKIISIPKLRFEQNIMDMFNPTLIH